MNGNNCLDRDESIRLIKATLGNLEAYDVQPEAFEEAAFDEAIAEFDKDNTGTISRGEMAAFVKRTAGL